ncbi:cysteine and histidine-rich domain-containing protein 1-like [Octopus sinensis]|uniref:Cysteine and histidine-rich domain-containing protein 1-like n=1 Tax=Octopus sinensis TaxID=2607531 RepID=A0A6P7TTJ8_9MOLL|nr:cysteine and histidine-rich domain-containing protein 1-like [Octopus sinensis]
MSLRCNNPGCFKTYENETNTENSCQYHSGEPLIRDSLKQWSCCGKKSLDFLKGCVYGQHSSVKPNITPKTDSSFIPEESVKTAPKEVRKEQISRPSKNQKMVPLEIKVEDSLRDALKDYENVTQNVTELKCLNYGCSAVIECRYHSMPPSFHDRTQLWPCCNKQSAEIEYFLKIGGCVIGDHRWPKNPGQTSCKVDFMDSADTVTVVVYARATDPQKCQISSNGCRLVVEATFSGNKYFETDIELFGVCKVDYGLELIFLISTRYDTVYI